MEDRLERAVMKFAGKVKEEITDRTKDDGTLDKRLAKELKDEIGRLCGWYSEEEKEILRSGIKEAARLGMRGQDAAAKKHMGELIEKYKEDKEVVGLFRKALADPNPMLLSATYGEGLPDDIADTIWDNRWQDGKKLSDRIWKHENNMRQNLDGMIEKGINEEKSAADLSRAVDDYLIKPGPTWRTDILPAKTDRATVKYNALRLARTETNHAYQHAQKMSAKNSELVKGVKWNLSMSHPIDWPPSAAYEGYPEICDYRAEEDHHGLGPGVYKADGYIPWDHPNGLCYLTDVLLKDKELMRLLKDKY
ncbi:hypothetical protein [Halarsenatibacter silvermanii]|uniref:hypothetical protein n=1 Tax=Halarsenatibacter silvermanii TaxID=321763 RepID=UPI00117AB032|nr:hypothetical protein [Halarsenatibacter silvermanii]